MIDPADIDGQIDFVTKRNQLKTKTGRESERKMLDQITAKKSPNALVLLSRSQIGLATMTTLFTIGLLYLINPPITQKKRTDDVAVRNQDWRRVLIVAAVVFVLTYGLPEIVYIITYFQNKRKLK
jgi:hypothetical protein